MSDPKRLRVLSFNIHKGFSTSNRKFTLEKIKQAIRSVSADLVFLQEVQGQHNEKAKRHSNWPKESQFEFLADSVWSHYAYGQNAVYDAGHHGNAILSKYPIESWCNHDVSTNRFESRGILHANINIPALGLNLQAICLHFNLLQSGRKVQMNELCRIVKSSIPKGSPLIIAGDFNDWRRTAGRIVKKELQAEEAFKALTGHYARSYPSRMPILHVDRVYYFGLLPVEAKVLKGADWHVLSDHAALLVDFKLP